MTGKGRASERADRRPPPLLVQSPTFRIFRRSRGRLQRTRAAGGTGRDKRIAGTNLHENVACWWERLSDVWRGDSRRNGAGTKGQGRREDRRKRWARRGQSDWSRAHHARFRPDAPAAASPTPSTILAGGLARSDLARGDWPGAAVCWGRGATARDAYRPWSWGIRHPAVQARALIPTINWTGNFNDR